MLICGHSNTIPDMLGALDVDTATVENPLASYDDLFMVILTHDEAGAIVSRIVQRLRYR